MARWIRASHRPRFALALLSIAAVAAAAHAEGDAATELHFARHGEPVATRDLNALRDLADAETVTVHEPYEDREVTFRALRLAPVLDRVFGTSWRDEEELLFTCRDGYQPTVPVRRALDHHAWLAFERPGADFTIDKLESGRRQQVSLAPFYLVWENLEDSVVRGEGDYGWPYQLVGIELVRARDRFPKMTPPASANALVAEGYTAFRMYCTRCHTINGEGGSIGPELNAPGQEVGLRDPDWLRRWIDDPSQFAPNARMPALDRGLPDRDHTLAALLAYLRAMATAAPAMAGEAGFFEAFYDSAWQHPWLLWAAAIAGVAIALSRSRLDPSLRRYAIALGVLSALDAWLTSSHVYGLGAKSAPWDSVVPLFFVLAGDFRYLLLVVAGTASGRLDASARGVATALGLTVIVPIASQLVLLALPESWSGSRVLFLVYESMFFVLAGALARFHPNVRRATWLRPLTRYVQLYYGLWATADILILATGADVGFALRVVPNLLYYGGLIGAIAWFAAGASPATHASGRYANDRA